MKFKVEKGVPMRQRVPMNAYPFSEMDVGDSFEVFTDDHRQFSCCVQQAAQRYRLNTGKNFRVSVRRSGGGHSRVWRVE